MLGSPLELLLLEQASSPHFWPVGHATDSVQLLLPSSSKTNCPPEAQKENVCQIFSPGSISGNAVPEMIHGNTVSRNEFRKYCPKGVYQEILSRGSYQEILSLGVYQEILSLGTISGNTVPREYIRKYCPREHIRRYYPGKKDLRHPITSMKHCFTMRKDNKCEKENLKI